jgi:cell division protein FtsW (lipid II flippase)
MTGIKQFMWYFIGLVAMIATIITVNKMEAPEGGIWFFMGIGLGLLVLSLLFGEVIGGAQNWIQLESLGVNFQPSEFVKIALVLAVASVFREKRRQLAYLPAYIFVLLCIVILVLLKDLGAALLYFFVFMVMMYAATGSKVLSFLGIAAFSGASVVAYNIFDHVRVRVQVWINPWATADTGGYQIIHGLIAIVSGGAFGSGLGLGSPRYVPAYTTDYVFSSICEEMGILMGILIIALYVFITLRGIKIAKNAENSFFSLLALGCTATIAFQTFIILGGVIKFIPLTGITLPLVSYGGSSMIVTMIFIGILQAIALRNSRLEDKNTKEAAS